MSVGIKIISGLIITMLVTSYIYKEEISQAVDPLYTPNDPVAVANDYWIVYLSKNALSASKFTVSSIGSDWIKNKNSKDRAVLGISNNVDGIYYIDTDLILQRESRQIIPMYTVVTSVNGSFKVNEYATFNSIHDAAISRFVSGYINSLENGSKYLSGDIVSQLDTSEFVRITKANLESRLCDTALTIIQNIDKTEDNLTMCLK